MMIIIIIKIIIIVIITIIDYMFQKYNKFFEKLTFTFTKFLTTLSNLE